MDHFLQLLVLHLVDLKLGKALLISSLPLLLGRFDLLLLFCFSNNWFRDILAIFQRLLPRVYLFLFWLRDIGPHFYFLRIDALHLTCKLLGNRIFTCIFYSFFFFYIQSSPPILAPRPPKRTHYFSAFFFLSRLFE